MFNGMVRVKAGRPLLGWFSRIIPLVGGSINRSWIKVIFVYVRAVHRLYKSGGMQHALLYIKACSILLQQSVGGQRIDDTGPFGVRVSRTKSGCPRIIPAQMRSRIRSGEARVIRAWMTLFGLYRVLEVPHVLKLSTITESGSPVSPEILSTASVFLREYFIPGLVARFRGRLLDGLKDPLEFVKGLRAKPFLIAKSSPVKPGAEMLHDENMQTVSTSPGAIRLSALIWRHSSLYPILEDWCRMTGSIWVLNRIDLWTKGLKPLETYAGTALGLGKLDVKFEAAGKVRVFAMVDCFTQWLLRPLHDAIFELLVQIPEDGTFDQLRPLKSLLGRIGKHRALYSYDLSAATDRLPITLQKVLLSPFLTSWGATLWASLLIGRGYKFPKVPSLGIKEAKTLYYARGQPMGALSSWAMLAFTHHFIVQFAAFRSGVIMKPGEWFRDYAVLGDDIVIGNGKVANGYLVLMTELGVGISAHKSLVGDRPVCEFAKKFVSKDADYTGVPLREVLVASKAISVALELVKAYDLSLGQLFTMMGYGYRVKGSLSKPLWRLGPRVRNLLLSVYAPGGPRALPPVEFLRLRSLDSKYGDKGRWPAVITNYLGASVRAFKERLEALASVSKDVARLVTVYRDREHYGTIPRADPYADILWENYFLSDILCTPEVVSSIKETVYREEFLDWASDVRSLHTQMDLLDEAIKVSGELDADLFSDMWTSLSEAEVALGALPLPRNIEKRASEVTRSSLLRTVRKWYKFSKPFRSTT